MLVLSITLVLTSIIFTLTGKSQESLVYIRNEEGEWFYPLNQDRIIHVKGPLGETEIHIENEQAWVLSSPCEFKTCVSHAPLKQAGDWNACLPNQVFLSLEGEENYHVDDQTF